MVSSHLNIHPELVSNKFTIRKMESHFYPFIYGFRSTIESMDLIFAIDSIPAILQLPKIALVYSSNIFAILGLRALFFVWRIL